MTFCSEPVFVYCSVKHGGRVDFCRIKQTCNWYHRFSSTKYRLEWCNTILPRLIVQCCCMLLWQYPFWGGSTGPYSRSERTAKRKWEFQKFCTIPLAPTWPCVWQICSAAGWSGSLSPSLRSEVTSRRSLIALALLHSFGFSWFSSRSPLPRNHVCCLPCSIEQYTNTGNRTNYRERGKYFSPWDSSWISYREATSLLAEHNSRSCVPNIIQRSQTKLDYTQKNCQPRNKWNTPNTILKAPNIVYCIFYWS